MSQILKQANKIRVSMENLQNVAYSYGGYMTYHYEGKPFSGYLVMNYHPNGYVLYEEEYKNGEHLGWDLLYHINGNLKRETLMAGATSLEFYEYDENGNKIMGGKVVSEKDYNYLVKKFKLLE